MKASEKLVLAGLAGLVVYLYRDKIFPAIGSAVTGATQAAGSAVADVAGQLTGQEACAAALVNGTDADIIANCPSDNPGYVSAWNRLHPGSSVPIDVVPNQPDVNSIYGGWG